MTCPPCRTSDSRTLWTARLRQRLAGFGSDQYLPVLERPIFPTNFIFGSPSHYLRYTRIVRVCRCRPPNSMRPYIHSVSNLLLLSLAAGQTRHRSKASTMLPPLSSSRFAGLWTRVLGLLVLAVITAARDAPSNLHGFYDAVRAKGRCSNELATGFYSSSGGPNSMSCPNISGCLTYRTVLTCEITSLQLLRGPPQVLRHTLSPGPQWRPCQHGRGLRRRRRGG